MELDKWLSVGSRVESVPGVRWKRPVSDLMGPAVVVKKALHNLSPTVTDVEYSHVAHCRSFQGAFRERAGVLSTVETRAPWHNLYHLFLSREVHHLVHLECCRR